ncbi:MAG: hypothetical protein JNK14_01505 [Chitinophagaceae bacterium]|nr:hypothetical protein [Chitinophagaceae bacterium]
MRHIQIILFIAIGMMITAPALLAQHTPPAPAASQWLHADSSSVTIMGFSITAAQTKTLLDWMAGHNEKADLFEVERSTDGKTFVTAAIVFGTDRPGTEKYSFFEKKQHRSFYRIKVICKNGSIQYSSVITGM